LFTDPCDEEEPLLENSFTVVCCLNRDDLSVYKQGGHGLDLSIIQEAFGLTKGRYDQVARIETLGLLEVQK
jgi:exosome complex RNA-binding protein Rrp42 (RNase PH superfamily)